MKLPDWLDVVLEGGALELQRALAEYRALRRLLAGDWRLHAGEVADLCHRLQAREHAVHAALERARRRAAQDPAARGALSLANEVEAERQRLFLALGSRGTFVARLLDREELARDISWFSVGLRRFRVERRAFLFLGAVGAWLVPFTSWLIASEGGRVLTVVDFTALGATWLSWLPLAALAGLVSAFALRLPSWSWLGVKPPSISTPALLTLLTAVASLGARLPFLSGLFLSLSCGLACALALLTWRAHRSDQGLHRLEALADVAPAEAVREPRRAQRSPA
ncbi:MAG: hypothetical protein AB1938_03925 [Myxococcota bacterium]